MKLPFIKAGEIVTTHGVRGEVKVLPWVNSAEVLAEFDRCRIGGSVPGGMRRRGSTERAGSQVAQRGTVGLADGNSERGAAVDAVLLAIGFTRNSGNDSSACCLDGSGR